MDTIAVHCSWAVGQLANDPILFDDIGPTLREAIASKSDGSKFLGALASAALQPRCTDKIFVLFQPLYVEITSRWIAPGLTKSLQDDLCVLSAFARTFPLARWSRARIAKFLHTDRFRQLLSDALVADLNVNHEEYTVILLAVFRLLSADPDFFLDLIKPTVLSSLFSHPSQVVRYLAVQCFCIHMSLADAFCESLTLTHVGDGPVIGDWEGQEIDFRMLRLLEEQRWTKLDSQARESQQVAAYAQAKITHSFAESDLSPTTASFDGVLCPRNEAIHESETAFVRTQSSINNLRQMGEALTKQKSILVSGLAGVGKTALIHEAARLLNQEESLISLHLAEQDAKTLLGVYTSSAAGDAFVWEPGVLTKAHQQGRWVVIEDIDRAPSEILGMLRPIIETGELFLPNRKERLRPAEGFRILATIKARPSDRGPSTRHTWLTNDQFWSTVEASEVSDSDMRQLIERRYPRILAFLREMMDAHSRICAAYRDEPMFKAAQARLPSIRDLMKWCRRVDKRLQLERSQYGTDTVSERFKSDMFMDALDCYAAFHQQESIYLEIAQRIARALNVPPQQLDHLINGGDLPVDHSKDTVTVGRSCIRKIGSRRQVHSKSNFALTNLAKRTMSSIAASIENREPVLLVGETGVGKTTIVQHIANLANQQLVVANMSTQTELTDLIGGLKPITTRSLVIPLASQFSDLFGDTFPSTRNEKFQQAVARAIAKQRWSRLLSLWTEAVQMAESILVRPVDTSQAEQAVSAKRRKLTSDDAALRGRWSEFSTKINQVRAQVERDKNHFFAYVESKLVTAAREGGWVLLDEINLASAETLQHVSGLFDNGEGRPPSLLLTEAGNVNVVKAHSDFRVFACMNPATDVGKKEFAPSLRSYFTEYYVQPGDTEVNDLIQVIDSHLGKILDNNRKAALDLANAYLELRRLNERHLLTDGAGEVPHFSIRSLVRCLRYVREHHASQGLKRAMYEGFAMSFFTVLSQVSEEVALSSIRKHLFPGTKSLGSFSSQVPRPNFDLTTHVAFKQYLVPRGPLTPEAQPQYILTSSVQRNLLNLARASSMRRFPILLQGPTSVGKTSMVEYLAKLSGNRFVRVNMSGDTDLRGLLGTYATSSTGKLELQDGVLTDAVRTGAWVCLDELNLASSDVLESINRLIDDNRELLIPESQEIVRPHPSFALFATQNPAGLYGGRKRLSRAFRNRFVELHFDSISEEEITEILTQRSQIAPSFCTQIVQVYKKLSLQRQSTRLFERNSFATLRDLFRWASRQNDSRQQLAQHGFMLLAERVRDPTERLAVKRTIEETMKVSIDEDALYGSSVIPATVGTSAVVWTKAMRRLYVLVTEALKNNEPVLLVGETGCGKTQICQTVADALGKDLSIYNAHANTEVSDLVGSQRPVRQRAELVDVLLEDLRGLSPQDFSQERVEGKTIDELIARFDGMDTSSLDPHMVAKTRKSIQASQTLFEWVDGGLVRSMKSGGYFCLDEISLAEDSVLERLNSVLEPSKTILLAEKGSVDSVVTAHHDWQFLSTMNPGGDYGKRELSPALRNRMTEIWVPPLSQAEDILPILIARLGDVNAVMAPAMLSFANWFKETIQNSSATIPLRSLLVWCGFITKNTTLTSTTAFVHGAAMVYIDSLGANPAGLVSASQDVDSCRKLCLSKLQTLAQDMDVSSLYNAIPDMVVGADKVQIGPFSMDRHAGCQLPELVFDVPTTLRNTLRLARALNVAGRPVLLEGSPGVGKTAIVSALAALLGRPLSRINLSADTEASFLFGTDTPAADESLGRFAWKDGPLLQAMRSGGMVLIDEMNLASSTTLEALNSLIDHRAEVYISELDKTFQCHENFTMIAAQNSHQQGGGRKGLPASFVNRFTVVYVDEFKREDISGICKASRSLVPDTVLDYVLNVVSRGQELLKTSPVLSEGGPWELNLRDTNRWLDLYENNKNLPPDHHLQTVITHRFRSSRAKSIIKSISDDAGQTSPDFSLFFNLSSQALQVGSALLSRNAFVQLCRSQKLLPVQYYTYAQSIMTALNFKWPVLLVSEGSGKSALIKEIAALHGAKLRVLSMSADTDTNDLVGAFDQHDPFRVFRQVRDAVCERIRNYLCETPSAHTNANALTRLVQIYNDCANAHVDQLLHSIKILSASYDSSFAVFEKLIEVIHKELQEDKSRFVWNDGVLIDALREGSWLYLNNANLCSASVLDRLCSLLEPNGRLVLDEQHNLDEEERVIVPHPQFRIFMSCDPRYGELSRPMRNRCLEIFMADDTWSEADDMLPTYATSASISRLRNLKHLKTAAGFADVQHSIAGPLINSFSGKDHEMMHSQLTHMVPFDLQDVCQRELDNWHFLPDIVRDSAEQLVKRMVVLIRSRCSPINAVDQPRLPVLNDALLSMSGLSSHDVESITRHIMQEFQFRELEERLAKVEESARQKKREDMNILEQSLLRPAKSARSASLGSLPAYQIIHSLISRCRKISNHNAAEDMRHRRIVIELASDLTTMFSAKYVDHSMVQAFAQIIRGYTSFDTSFQTSISNVLSDVTNLFGPQHNLKYGYGLGKMWRVWKPATAETWEQLENQKKMEALLVEFDRVAVSVPQSRSSLATIRSRLSQTYANLLVDQFATAIVPNLETAVGELKAQYLSRPRTTLFGPVFHWMQRRLAAENKFRSAEEAHILALLSSSTSRYPATNLDTDLVRSLKLISFVSDSEEGTDTRIGIFQDHHLAKEVSEKLCSVKEQSIGDLSFIEEEAQILATTLCCHTDIIENNPSVLVAAVARTILRNILTPFVDDGLSPAVSSVLDSSELASQLASIPGGIFTENAGSRARLQALYDAHIKPHLVTLSHDRTGTTPEIGLALIHMSVAALKLYVPEQAFDPSLYHTLVARRYQQRKTEYESQLESYRHFQRLSTGQDTSTAVRMFEKDLHELGAMPPTVTILRPERSQMELIREEFLNVIRGVLESGHLLNVLERNDEALETSAFLLHGTLNLLVQRLSRLDRAYDDIIKPVTWTLNSLSLGLSMLLVSEPSTKVRSDPIDVSITTLSPRCCLEPSPTLNNLAGVPFSIFSANLERLKLSTDINGDEPRRSEHAQNLLSIVDSLYLEWKSRLSKEQVEAEAQSRYYSYRGEDDSIDELDQIEIARLFPTFEGAESDANGGDVSKYDARMTAIRLSQFHEQMFEGGDAQDTLRKTMLNSLRRLGSSRKRDTVTTGLLDVLPCIMMQLQDTLSELKSADQQPAVNIYTDSNVVESRKLINLVESVEERFQAIHNHWFEHAIPIEVIGFCGEFWSTFKIDEPLAKLMSKLEKLLMIVAQWQSVASKEWSVTNLIEEITTLIIHWRRLELSSWSRLLDNEEKKNDEDSRAWYFIAYEAVVHSSRLVAEQSDNVQDYCVALSKTIEEFLQSATLGRFKDRMKLLDIFLQTLKLLPDPNPRLQSIITTIAGTLNHFRRYQDHIQSTISKGRADLEKQVNEQIKLASWRDTNVQSLRESARRSHVKLFKLVKKFRSFLGQPLVFKTGDDEHPSLQMNMRPLAHIQWGSNYLTSISRYCALNVPGWEARPDRLKDPIGASNSMRRLYLTNEQSFKVSLKLAEMTEDIGSAMKSLRKETPQTLTEDNKSLVRHLRERKRRLFAETLKNLTIMGVRRNLGTAELNRQSSTSMVLASSADVSLRSAADTSSHANNTFHEFLDVMIQVRSSVRDHTDDLTDGEIARGSGFLEGLLSLMMAQRNSCGTTANLVQSFRDKINALKTLSDTDLAGIYRMESQEISHRDRLRERATWLPPMLKVARRVLKFQSDTGRMDFTEILTKLHDFQKQTEVFAVRIKELARLPSCLSTRADADIFDKFHTSLHAMYFTLEKMQTQEPKARYLLQKLQHWTDVPKHLEIDTNGVVHASMIDFDRDLRRLLDRVFVAMQKIASVQAGMPESTEDAAWLTKSSTAFVDMAKMLHLADFVDDLDGIFDSIRHLSTKDLELMLAMLMNSAPILEQYLLVAEHVNREQITAHFQTGRLSLLLSRSFLSLIKDGFCTPTDPSDSKEQQSGNLESGTGLGEGEGAEDISKDIGADEDLSELAQAASQDQGDKEMDKSKDAVDMGADEMEGAMDSAGEGESENDADESGTEDEDDLVDEETGSVDELDPSAVDEKMWEGQREKESNEKDMKSDKAKGQKSDEQTAKDEGNAEEDDQDAEGMDESPEEDDETDAEDENEGQGILQEENIDSHVPQEEQNLELPEDMQIGGDDGKDEQVDETDDLSDMELPDGDPALDEADHLSDHDEEQQKEYDGQDDVASGNDAEDEIGQAQDDEVVEEQPEEGTDQDDEKDEDLATRDNDMQYDLDENQAGDSGQANQKQDQSEQNPGEDAQGQNETDNVVNEQQMQLGKGSEQEQEGKSAEGLAEQGSGREEQKPQARDDALKQLADILESYRKREILTASENRQQDSTDQDVDMADADVEHLNDEDEQGDGQALGAADQAQNLDNSKAIEDHDATADEDLPMPDEKDILEESQETLATLLQKAQLRTQKQDELRAATSDIAPHMQDNSRLMDHDDIMEDDIERGETQESSQLDTPESSVMPASDAAEIWSLCSTRVHALSLVLTEQLRLVLEPTTATKLRGGFRSGKRLNIKAIIPYIASGYKRDKIWMRRSIPSKRDYQIMIAVDDSKSMGEFGADLMALETLAMLCKSLSMLEAGDFCIMRFAEDNQVVHPFGQSFTASDGGPEVFRQFSFKQQGTDVRRLMQNSLPIFRDARLRNAVSEDLWQLQLIISDGHCSDHEAIRRLVLAAFKERIVTIFVIVDASQDSILDLKEAVFERTDPLDERSPKAVKTRRYLESFPFQYYVVVRDVGDLPGVLAKVLKGWFESVVDVA